MKVIGGEERLKEIEPKSINLLDGLAETFAALAKSIEERKSSYNIIITNNYELIEKLRNHK